MNFVRLSILALSLTLMFSIGSSLSAATDYSHPEFSATDDRVLNLRETGSQIVTETIEDAIRQGGVGLLGEGFQLDSSLNYIFGETIEGDIDVVVPLWSKDEHVVFTQPGLIVWSGIEEENRIDGNLGVVYRTNLANIIGINAIGGASLFYDHDFQVGHSRISVGADIQSGFLHGSANYYQPLSDAEEGRTGYIEDAIRGMDARLVYERRKIRLSGNLGYWRYEGDGTGKGNWELSYGMDAGIRVLKGIFIEGGYEKHDDASIDDRLNLGVAFKFSLPGFEGASYGDGSMSSNLYKIIDREKRILYEEREDMPKVSIVLSESVSADTIVEGGTVNLEIRLEEAFEENITFYLTARGSARYNNDWTISIGGTKCAFVSGGNCPIIVEAGETVSTDDIVITINDDGRTNENAETIILTTSDASGDRSLISHPLVITIPAEGYPELSIVPLPVGRGEIVDEGDFFQTDIYLNQELQEDVTINLVGSGTATYGTNGDWTIAVNATPCPMVTEDNCQVTIHRGNTGNSHQVLVRINDDRRTGEPAETIVLSAVIADSGNAVLMPAEPLTLTIAAD